MNLFAEIDRNNQALLEAMGVRGAGGELIEVPEVCNGCFNRDDSPTGCTKNLRGPNGGRLRNDCYTDPVDHFRNQRREAEAVAHDHFAASPRCHGVSVGGFHFRRTF